MTLCICACVCERHHYTHALCVGQAQARRHLGPTAATWRISSVYVHYVHKIICILCRRGRMCVCVLYRRGDMAHISCRCDIICIQHCMHYASYHTCCTHIVCCNLFMTHTFKWVRESLRLCMREPCVHLCSCVRDSRMFL
jgi:hypothetical protein